MSSIETTATIRFDYVLEKSSFLLDFHVIVRISICYLNYMCFISFLFFERGGECDPFYWPMMESLIKMKFYPLYNQVGVGIKVDLQGALVAVDSRIWSL